jgi:hypothetical protein
MSDKNSPLIRYMLEFNREDLSDKRFSIKAGWSSLTPEKRRSTQRAMRHYRKSHPYCEITGSDKKIQIHHIVPVWANPDLADDPDNFIALSSSSHIHHIYGHDRNFARKYVKNIREISKKFLALQKEFDIVHRTEAQMTQNNQSKLKEGIAKIFCSFLDT